MNEFEKWLKGTINANDEAINSYVKDNSTNHVFKEIHDNKIRKEILSKYEELTKDKIVLVLDKEEAEFLESGVEDVAPSYYLEHVTDDLSKEERAIAEAIKRKCKKALNK